MHLHGRALARASARSGVPQVRKFGYLCIQEILVLTKSSVRTSVRTLFHVNRCEMAQVLAWSPRHILCVSLGIGHLCYGQLTAVWPVSHDCIAGSSRQLIEVTYFLKLFAGFQLIAGSGFFKVESGGIQFAFCLGQKFNCLRKTFLKRSLEGFVFGLG